MDKKRIWREIFEYAPSSPIITQLWKISSNLTYLPCHFLHPVCTFLLKCLMLFGTVSGEQVGRRKWKTIRSLRMYVFSLLVCARKHVCRSHPQLSLIRDKRKKGNISLFSCMSLFCNSIHYRGHKISIYWICSGAATRCGIHVYLITGVALRFSCVWVAAPVLLQIDFQKGPLHTHQSTIILNISEKSVSWSWSENQILFFEIRSLFE